MTVIVLIRIIMVFTNEDGENIPTPIKLQEVGLFIPQGFSPNGDGADDYFVIHGAEQYRVTIKIFNRWGNIVYENYDYKNDWDGKATKGVILGDELPDGTYYYIISLNNGGEPFVRYFTIKR